MADTYKKAGVDIDAGNEAVRLMGGAVRSTFRPEVLSDIGGFGGLFALDLHKYKEPVLVSGADGVGTKLKVAFMADKHDTVGQDAVAMCVNDILVQGAEPLFFLDYLAVGRLEPEKVAEIVGGVAAGCRLAGCALLGGETAEMPGFYRDGEYDLAGFAVGVVDRQKIINGRRSQVGDLVIGLPSTGLHSNGFSLARKIFFEGAGWSLDRYIPELGKTLGEELLTPTKIYVRPVLNLLAKTAVRGMAHITGGGLLENVPRCLPPGLGVSLERQAWTIPPVFALLQRLGDVSEDEMFRTFNMGIGFVLVIAKDALEIVMTLLREAGEAPLLLGEVVPKEGVRL
ncbi:MAG: phosphoribosylformylglycinamidine cyclo-ligase [Dethiobacter sp.]|nr:phosphoribosylformylglycinamidine cyclo-ligase [Dethiobacter sp.]MBS3900300.1 phosphoribosylformylglycinamidine cyclo-ligase [Dethiobacter sp.]MBS3982681.1 phosphoribosylformylglycinamidine cyclo-ligase [Dethiobacter sp.]